MQNPGRFISVASCRYRGVFILPTPASTSYQMENAFAVRPHSPETVVIRIGKTLDFRNAAQFKTVYQKELGTGAKRFVLDFSETNIFDSTGLGSLFSLFRHFGGQTNTVVIASPSRPVQTVLQLTSTHKIFRQFTTVSAACQALDPKALEPEDPAADA